MTESGFFVRWWDIRSDKTNVDADFYEVATPTTILNWEAYTLELEARVKELEKTLSLFGEEG